MLKYPSCADWNGTGSSDWVYGAYGFIRGNRGVFSFSIGDWTYEELCGRGVAVIGTGL